MKSICIISSKFLYQNADLVLPIKTGSTTHVKKELRQLEFSRDKKLQDDPTASKSKCREESPQKGLLHASDPTAPQLRTHRPHLRLQAVTAVCPVMGPHLWLRRGGRVSVLSWLHTELSTQALVSTTTSA